MTALRIAWLEGKLLLREPITVVYTLGLPLAMLVVMGVVFGNEAEEGFYRDVGAMDYYMGAYVALVVAALGVINLPTHLATYRERGVLRRFEASSIPKRTLFIGQGLVMVVLSGIAALLVLVAGKLIFHPANPQSPLLLLGGFVLTSVAFAALGTLLGLAMPTARAAQGIGIMLWFLMLMLGGAGPPPEVLHSMAVVGSATPIRHAIILLQDAWLGWGWNWSKAAILFGVFVGSIALTALVVKRQATK